MCPRRPLRERSARETGAAVVNRAPNVGGAVARTGQCRRPLVVRGAVVGSPSSSDGREEILEMIVGLTMLERATTLEDVGSVAAFAASDHACTSPQHQLWRDRRLGGDALDSIHARGGMLCVI